MASKARVGRPRRDTPRDTRALKAPTWMAQKVGAIAQLTERTQDEVLEQVCAAAVNQEFDRVVTAGKRKA